MADMRGSDWVDLGFEFAPKVVVRAVLVALAVAVYVFHYTAPIDWYIQDKVAGVMEMVQGIMNEYVDDLTDALLPATPPSAEPVIRSFE